MEKKNNIKKIAKCVPFSVILFIYLLFKLLSLLITSTAVIRLLIGGLIAVVVISFLFIKPVFYAFILVYTLVVFFTTYLVMYKDKGREKGGFSSGGRNIDNIFAGMNKEDAKKKYHELIKQYHPDNTAGNSSMAQKIVTDYSLYKEQNGYC